MKNADGDLEYENKQNKMKLEAANKQITLWKDRYYKVDKAEALVKYWQAQNYARFDCTKWYVFKHLTRNMLPPLTPDQRDMYH